MRKLVDHLVEEKLKTTRSDQLNGPSKNNKRTPVKNSVGGAITGNTVKSPSDTTIYTPAFVNRNNNRERVVNRVSAEVSNTTPIGKDRLINDVTHFLDALRVEQYGDDRPGGSTRPLVQPTANTMVIDQASGGGGEIAGTPIQVTPELLEARARADKMVMDAERFQATLATPPGKSDTNMYKELHQAGVGTTDDDFFHLTCHVDKQLKEKIEHGEYVDLEKLLPKDKSSEFGVPQTSNRLEWIHQDGQTFLAPATNKSNRISNVKKWDQAFRIYATIYCGANPSRSKEIWQYVSIIHTAANSFVWENVASYDYTFCHLMEFNPQRSWATTYTQMWNLTMCELLIRNNFTRNNGNGSSVGSGTFSAMGSTPNPKFNGKGKNKGDYCWSYNKGQKCKFGKSCKFIERCSYCDGNNHGRYNCHKLAARRESSDKEGEK